jgi:RHS repeat-associated protein
LGFRYLYVGSYGVAWDGFAAANLQHMGARTYSPSLGRFLQPDPSDAEANLYGYAENSPVTKVDPDGQCAMVATNPWHLSLQGLACALERIGAATASAASGLAAFALALPFVLQGDTVKPVPATRIKRKPPPTRTTCFVIGEVKVAWPDMLDSTTAALCGLYQGECHRSLSSI